MKQALSFLFKENLASWLRARGFVIVMVAALVPAGLTAAWVYTHQGDIAVTGIDYEPDRLISGQPVNITATVENKFPRDAPSFDVLVEVGVMRTFAGEEEWVPEFSHTERVRGLRAEESTTVTAQWIPGDNILGHFQIRVEADPEEELRETQRINNVLEERILVHPPAVVFDLGADDEIPGDDDDEGEGGDEAGDGPLPRVEVRIDRVSPPAQVYENEEAVTTVVVENLGPGNLTGGTLRAQFDRIRFVTIEVDDQRFQQPDVVPFRTETLDLDVPAGEQVELQVPFTPTRVDVYRLILTVDIDDVADDPDKRSHQVVEFMVADRRLDAIEADEGRTAKWYYRSQVLDQVHLKILVPLIALVFAAGVLNDERRKNTLPYLFSRPIPRWGLPMVRFVVSFIVAGIAVAVGIFAVNAILLGQPDAELEFLYWPLGLTLGALFVYGAVFTLLGVTTQRPYLWGLLYVLGVEFVIYAGRYVLMFNERPFFQSWAEFLSLNHWFLQVFAAWDPSRVSDPWLATHSVSALFAGVGLALAAVAALVASAVLIQRRDIE